MVQFSMYFLKSSIQCYINFNAPRNDYTIFPTLVYGICEGLAAGAYTIEVRIDQYGIVEARKNIGNAYLGWNSAERFLVQEVRLGSLYSNGMLHM